MSCEVLICKQQKPVLANINIKTNVLKDIAGGSINLVKCILEQPLWKIGWHCLLKLNTVYAESVI